MTVARVLLQPRRARPFYGRHPWVFPGAIASVEGDPADGGEVEVYSHGGAFIARGLYNSKSRIRVRLYSWEPERPLDRAFFRDRLEQAIRLRREPLRLLAPGQACRLVFSEGDGLSGLTVDQYDRWLVVQFTSLALAQRREMWAELLCELLQPEGIFLRTERGIGKLEGLELQDGPLWGQTPAEPILIQETCLRLAPGMDGGVKFLVNLAEGQKTGFYLDQRENRQVVAGYAAGRRVLDGFCYTGGFGLHAARAGAREVLGVDGSESAIDLARRNAALNGLTAMSFTRADVFEFLQQQVLDRQRFQLIILDPPKFARTPKAVEDALRAYRRLQTLALLLLEPDSFLVTCCCSGLIDMGMLETLSAQVAAESKRSVQIMERRGQPPDHPIAVACLESSYLKCLITRVL
jgi:23S rRNA (cytosine1962-C5)-methyltransferase